MARHKLKNRHDTNEAPFEYNGKTLVFTHFDGLFYCYNVVNLDGNFRGTHQSKIQLHADE